ncbi:MAG TPA: helix-turn-helix domain-containing protein [Pyrinomonadaceae bacterium]|nr:helix-turn-helix domain-containing protein [Pyrinomonadaceae bacterium]
MSGDERRGVILRAAVELFSQHGFKGATTKEIAKASGVSEAMLFRHFENKDALYQAIIETKGCRESATKFACEDDDVLKSALDAKDDEAVFYRLALTVLEKQQSNVPFVRLLLYSALEDHELAEKFFHEFIERVYVFIGGYIQGRQKDGVFRKMEARLAVRAFLGMLLHHSLNNVLWDKSKHLLKISNEEAAKGFADILLKGLEAERA